MLQDCGSKLSEGQYVLAEGVDLLDLYVKDIKTLGKKVRDVMESIGQFDSTSIRKLKSIERKRFMPLGIIGYLSSSLFGVVSEDEITKVNQNIDKLFQGLKNSVELGDKRAHAILFNFDELSNITKSHKTRIND